MKIISRLKNRARLLKKQILTLYYASSDPAMPLLPKILAALTIAYALSPVDLIPDFIPVLGYLDDLILLPGLIALTVKSIPKDVWARAEHRAEEEPLKLGKNWAAGIFILLLWTALAVLAAVKIVFPS